jgi:hypothetical protein
MFGHGDTFHHTSLDTPDKVDSSELRRVCALTLGLAYYLASAGEAEAADMARLVVRNGLGRLAAETYDALPDMAAADAGTLADAYGRVQVVLSRAAARERAAVLSAARYAARPETARTIARTAEAVEALAAVLRAEADKAYLDRCRALNAKPLPVMPSSGAGTADRLVPVRHPDFICPLETDYLVEKLGPEVRARLRLRGNAAYEALNFVDGKRTTGEIRNAVSAACGPQNPADLAEYFNVLVEAGLITWKK